jgi:hypothetical protein
MSLPSKRISLKTNSYQKNTKLSLPSKKEENFPKNTNLLKSIFAQKINFSQKSVFFPKPAKGYLQRQTLSAI